MSPPPTAPSSDWCLGSDLVVGDKGGLRGGIETDAKEFDTLRRPFRFGFVDLEAETKWRLHNRSVQLHTVVWLRQVHASDQREAWLRQKVGKLVGGMGLPHKKHVIAEPSGVIGCTRKPSVRAREGVAKNCHCLSSGMWCVGV
jgi:hypothetical protein